MGKLIKRILPLALLALLSGCGEKGVDSHTEVFKTADEIADYRREKLLASHKELAVSVLRFARPDLAVKAGEAGAIDVSADGITQSIDLLPIEPDMANNSNRERAILRKYLDAQLRPFDERRVRELGFEKVKEALRFDLLNEGGLAALQATAGTSKIRAMQVVSGLYRVTMVHRPGATVPVIEQLIAAWHTTGEAVDSAATDAMRAVLRSAGDKAFDTTSYSTVGRTGTLRVDAGVIVLPEFLDAVHKAWRTNDNLVLAAPSSRGVQFMESQNTRLAEIVLPQWRQLIVTSPDPLYSMMLLRTQDGLSPFIPREAKPTPATVPATKPIPYFVH